MSKYRGRTIKDRDTDRAIQDLYKVINKLQIGSTVVISGSGSSGSSCGSDENYIWDYTTHTGSTVGATMLVNSRLEEVIIKVDTAFNNSAKISINDGVETLMDVWQNDLLTVSAYSTGKIFKKYTSDTNLTISFSGSPTVGEGIIIFKIKSI